MYDYLIITNLPAFYKVNLYIALAKQLKIKVIFVGSCSTIRTQDFTTNHFTFSYEFLCNTEVEKRCKYKSLLKLRKILKTTKYRKVLLGGWDLPEYWLAHYMSSTDVLCLALESSSEESTLKGWKKKIKQVFLRKISTVFPSGKGHQQLLRILQYQGKQYITEGVGIFNYAKKSPKAFQKVFSGKFLYVGRFSIEKNLPFIISFFNEHTTYSLTLVGKGPELNQLRAIAKSNINFIPHVPNAEISQIYQAHDIFILPSLKEPWGLVVEEALYYGLPVIASKRVGCALDLIVKYNVGTVFSPTKRHILNNVINEDVLSEQYQIWQNNIQKIDFIARDARQIDSYVKALS